MVVDMGETDLHRDLDELNKREPKQELILRLLAQANANGKKIGFPSVVDALEFSRDQYGLSRHEFAAVIGVSPGHYSEIINGKRRLSINAAKRAFAIGVPADVLLQP